MSAYRSPRIPRPPAAPATPPEMERLRSRRREARRRRRLARLDLGIGVFVAIVLFVISPGLAITALVALLTLLACLVSVVLERRRARAPRSGPRQVPRGASSPRSRREAETGARPRPRSPR